MSTMLALCILALAADPRDTIPVDHIDLVELNHYYDENGKHVFDQIIYWEWSCVGPEGWRFNVVAWRMADKPSKLPYRSRGKWIATWHEDKKLRKIVANAYRETWTQYDPEVLERKILHKDKRTGLTKYGKCERANLNAGALESPESAEDLSEDPPEP